MRLIDAFMYFDEDLMLDLRLNILNDIVDTFVITEATKDHAGNDKKLNFNIKNFKKFENKIKYIIVEDMPEITKYFKKNWESAHLRDQFQRNSLARGFKDLLSDDLIMISDIDEIPDPNKINEFQIKNKYGCFILKNFQSKFNQINITENNWSGTKICKKKYLRSPQWLRNIKTKKRPFWKFYKPKEPQLIFNGGWHFSYLKKPMDISNKIKSFAHQEFNKENFTDVNKIEKKIVNMSDIFGRDYIYKRVELDESFPKYILDNQEKYREWII